MNIEKIAINMMIEIYNVNYTSGQAWDKIKNYMANGESTSFVHPILDPLSTNNMKGYSDALRALAASFPNMNMDLKSIAVLNNSNEVHLDYIFSGTFSGAASPITGATATGKSSSLHSMWRIVFNQDKKIVEAIKGFDTAGWQNQIEAEWL